MLMCGKTLSPPLGSGSPVRFPTGWKTGSLVFLDGFNLEVAAGVLRTTVQNSMRNAFGVGFAIERLFDLVSMVVLALKAWRIGWEHSSFPHSPSIIMIFSKTFAGASALTANHSLLSGLAKSPTYSAKNSLGLCVATREIG